MFIEIAFGQILDAEVRRDPGILQNRVRAHAPDPVNVGQPDFHALGAGKINACYTRHTLVLRPSFLVPGPSFVLGPSLVPRSWSVLGPSCPWSVLWSLVLVVLVTS